MTTTTASSPLLDARRALIDEEDGYVACDAPTSEGYRDERRRRRWSVGTMRTFVLVALASTLVVVPELARPEWQMEIAIVAAR